MNNYLDDLVSWVLAHKKHLRLAFLAGVVLYYIKPVAVIALALGATYWLFPEVRPYWNTATLYFFYGIQQLV